MSVFAKIAMVLFLGFATFELAEFWGGQLLGIHNDIWEAFELGPSDTRPNALSILFGAALHLAAFAGSPWPSLRSGAC